MTTTTGQNSTHAYTQTTDPALPPNMPPGYTITRIPCNGTASRTASRITTRTASRNGTQTHSQSRCKNGTVISIVPVCTPLPSSKTFTRYLVVHTSTVTFKGHRSDYKAPYAPIATPNYCDPSLYPAVPRPPPPGSTPEPLMGTMSMITETFTIEGQPLTAEFPVPSLFTAIAHIPVTTFITTDKNPSVVFPSDPIPNYSQTWPGGGDGGDGVHTPVGGGAPAPGSDAPSYTITAGPTSVLINEQTFIVAPGSSTIVTANDGGVFTINPTAVVGQGVTITRPPSVMGPASSVLDGIPVTSAGPSLEIGGGAFAIPTSDSNTVRVNGKAVTINPTGVTIGGESMGFVKPAASDVVVAGGEMLTAIGRSVVVLHSITYTYGSGIAPVMQVVNGDTIAIGPTGVLVHGSTLGGVSAQPTDTEFEIVGGATIAKIPPSMVIVNGETYAVGPGASMKTVVIGEQTLTMGPIGLVMASTTMKFPFDASVTTTIAGRSTGESMPQETGSKGEEDAAYSLRPDVRVGLTCLCIVFGVLVLA
ncbi:hypothetical protein LMH87_006703 [Akanthomyces muscarius]|uniref:Uncharacterized protein n=1 Tax=Akanthomyces muscarius TaxID=2231603 RepID=A0A9W8URQ7_AKAMU|nr:hypothetical protein LMH87_006703 [Akanthomyces muscarius]KAJ4165056.1 hypothetical protein LMH87_006703 [Akanthomyces muscarius]